MKVLQYISLIIGFIGFLLVVGMMGAIELDRATIATYITGIVGALMFIFSAIINR